MRWLTSLAGYVAPIFLILSPVLSYSDQAMAMHRNKSSAGFSLDIPLIMLIASMFRCVALGIVQTRCACPLIFGADVFCTGYSTTRAPDSTLRCSYNRS